MGICPHAEVNSVYFHYCLSQTNSLLLLQETPARISVSGLSMRTTSSLEAHNGALNKQIVHRANFFKFVHDIRFQEFNSSNSFEEFITSGGQCDEARPKYKVKK